MENLSRKERIELPNTVLLDPLTVRAAAYNGIHRLITDDASPALVSYARRKKYMEAPYDASKRDPSGRWMPLPPWAAPEILSRLIVIWVRSGAETDDELRSMPCR